MKKILLIISMIAVLLLVGCGKKEDTNVPENTNTQQQELIENVQENNDTQETVTMVSKLDDSRDWVYDAEYEKNVIADSYTNSYDETYFAKDIVVPYINVDSPDANRINLKIKDIMEELVSTFNAGATEEEPKRYINECRYEYSANNDILSGMLVYSVGQTAVPVDQYYVFNLSLKDGRVCTYEDCYTACGFSKEDIDSKVKSKITELVSSYLTEEDDEGFVQKSIDTYDTLVSENNIMYFIDSNNKLNVISRVSIPVEQEIYYKVLTID